MNLAIVAHFDPDYTWNSNFLLLIQSLLKTYTKIVVVTTSEIYKKPIDSEKILLISRPNIGYDFLSYKVGLFEESFLEKYKSITFLNSSFIITNENIFSHFLTKVNDTKTNGYALSALTASRQIVFHLQSYFLHFDLCLIPLKTILFLFENIKPENTKYEIIEKYEIGLTQKVIELGFSCGSFYCPSRLEKLKTRLTLIHSERSHLFEKFKEIVSLKNINWTHFSAIKIVSEYGLIKSEVLRSNPKNINLKKLNQILSIQKLEELNEFVEKTKNNYTKNSTGLNQLIQKNDAEFRLKYFSPNKGDEKIAVILHLFYFDLFDEILEKLSYICEPYHLYITTPNEGDFYSLINKLDILEISSTISLCHNKGRDVLPFLTCITTYDFKKYDAILKIHTKKSKYSENGAFWRHKLFNPLIGNSCKVIKNIQMLRTNKDLGIIGPDEYFLTNQKYLGANILNAKNILRKLNLDIPFELGFFAGTMFWFSPKWIDPILCLGKDGINFDFREESGAQDGTQAHAWERLFSLIARSQGYKSTTPELKGVDVLTRDYSRATVPVL